MGSNRNKKFKNSSYSKDTSSRKSSDSFRGKDRRKDVAKSTEDYTYSANDPRFYGADPQLVKDVASFPYGWPLGTRMNYGPMGAGNANYFAMPGIMTIHWAPTVGWADDANAPVNVAARNIYSYVRHANSGHSNYDAPDLMMYLLGMDSVYSLIASMKRVYGVLNTASYTNRYYPQAIVQALGYDYDDLIDHISDFRALINQAVVKAGSMCVPATMPYFKKHQWMCEHLYSDHNSTKSQTYVFVMDKYYQFALDGDGAGMLMSKDMPYVKYASSPTLMTFSTAKGILLTAIDTIMEQEDFNIMSGDILKAYGPDKVVKISSIDEVYTVLPHYDETALDQIQNATLIGYPCLNDMGYTIMPDDNMDVVQSDDKSYLKSHVYTCSDTSKKGITWGEDVPGLNIYSANRVISFTHDGITPDDTMEATRMANIASNYQLVTHATSGYGAMFGEVTTVGSEIAFYGTVVVWSDRQVSYDWAQGWKIRELPFTASVVNLFFADVNDDRSLQVLWSDVLQRSLEHNVTIEMIDQFNRHPVVALTHAYCLTPLNGDREIKVVPFSGIMFDTDNYTILDADDIREMAETALLSEFTVTQYGREFISK